LHAEVEDAAGDDDARIRHEDVDHAVGLDTAGDRLLAVGLVGHVADDLDDVRARLAQALGGGGEALAVHVREHKPGAVAREACRGGGADAGGCAGDDGGLAFEESRVAHCCPSLSTSAITRAGAPVPPRSRSGSPMKYAPRAGSRRRLARPSKKTIPRVKPASCAGPPVPGPPMLGASVPTQRTPWSPSQAIAAASSAGQPGWVPASGPAT